MTVETVDQTHPQYAEQSDNWQLLNDCYEGEAVVKARTHAYLPPTSGMIQDGAETSSTTDGAKAYSAYLKRAVFPEYVSDAIDAALGVMHLKPPTIELPAALEPLRESATLDNENLEQLLRRIHFQQLLNGRLGLMLDVPDGQQGDVLPYVALYDASSIINWDAGLDSGQRRNLNLVVLNESGPQRSGLFSWEEVDRYRVLILGEPEKNEPATQAGLTYKVAVVEGKTNPATDFIEPRLPTGKLDRIPFVFVNSADIVPEVDRPPLLGLASRCLAIYRGEADYRQALFMQGQDTLVISGMLDDDTVIRTGANAHIKLPMGGDAKYIGVESAGLEEQRAAIENDHAIALQKGGQLLDNTSKSKESGDALRVRVAARTATLTRVAQTGAYALQEILRIAALWKGVDPEQVVVEPNLDFSDDTLAGKELVDLAAARSLGAPISKRSIHELMQQRGLTNMDYEEELAELESEPPDEEGGQGLEDE